MRRRSVLCGDPTARAGTDDEPRGHGQHGDESGDAADLGSGDGEAGTVCGDGDGSGRGRRTRSARGRSRGVGATDAEALGDGAAVVGATVGLGLGRPGTDHDVAVRVTGRLTTGTTDEGTPDDSARHSRVSVAVVDPEGTTAVKDDPMGTLTAAPAVTGAVAETTTVLPPAVTDSRAPSRAPAGHPSAKSADEKAGYAAASPA